MEKENNSTVKAVSFMMIITLVGKILGLIRDQLLAGNYSVGMEASAFLTASRIPRIFFDVVFASAISASFIPVFNEYMKKRGKEEAFRLSNNFITVVLMLTSVITDVSISTTVIKLFERRKASSFPLFFIYSLKTGIKLAEIAEANTTSKNILGILLAVRNALASIPTE